MGKYSKRILALLIATTLLSGCGKKKVDYNNAADGASTDGETLESQLQLNGLDVWKERITSNVGDIFVNCNIVVPDTPTMYTCTVHERYLSNEDKKDIMTYFADEDTLKVAVDQVLTKEYWQQCIDTSLTYYEENNLPPDEYELQFFEERRDEAPNEADLSEDVGDYSAKYYTGNNGEYSYDFLFGVNQQYNSSFFQVYRINPNDDEIPENTTTNICSMSMEEAKVKALSILADLGINNMMVSCISDRSKYKYDIDNNGDITEEYEWLDGYEIYVTRDINGATIPAEGYIFDDMNDPEDIKPFNSEYIYMTLDDNGVDVLQCTGLMDDGTLNASVKILSFDKIQEILRTELENTDNTRYSNYWQRIRLTYMRIDSETVEDEYTYIPVWSFEPFYSDYMYDYRDVIIVNAIDGKIMDPIEDGLVTMYFSQQGRLYN